MYTPQPREFRKPNRHGFRRTYERHSCALRFGSCGLQALEPGVLSASQIETLRRTLAARLKRKGKI